MGVVGRLPRQKQETSSNYPTGQVWHPSFIPQERGHSGALARLPSHTLGRTAQDPPGPPGRPRWESVRVLVLGPGLALALGPSRLLSVLTCPPQLHPEKKPEPSRGSSPAHLPQRLVSSFSGPGHPCSHHSLPQPPSPASGPSLPPLPSALPLRSALPGPQPLQPSSNVTCPCGLSRPPTQAGPCAHTHMHTHVPWERSWPSKRAQDAQVRGRDLCARTSLPLAGGTSRLVRERPQNGVTAASAPESLGYSWPRRTSEAGVGPARKA